MSIEKEGDTRCYLINLVKMLTEQGSDELIISNGKETWKLTGIKEIVKGNPEGEIICDDALEVNCEWSFIENNKLE